MVLLSYYNITGCFYLNFMANRFVIMLCEWKPLFLTTKKRKKDHKKICNNVKAFIWKFNFVDDFIILIVWRICLQLYVCWTFYGKESTFLCFVFLAQFLTNVWININGILLLSCSFNMPQLAMCKTNCLQINFEQHKHFCLQFHCSGKIQFHWNVKSFFFPLILPIWGFKWMNKAR